MSQSLLDPSGPQSADNFAAEPLRSPVMDIEPAWIDYNGHLNVAYYHLLFDRAVDGAYEALGIGLAYLKERNHSLFTLETHACHLRELVVSDRVVVETVLFGHDTKRLHLFQTMRQESKGFVAATSEHLAINVDLATRRGAPFSDDALARITRLASAQAGLPRPEQAGRSVSLGR